jgi:hypothetical protein
VQLFTVQVSKALRSATPPEYWLSQPLVHVVLPVVQLAMQLTRETQAELPPHVEKLGQQLVAMQSPHGVPFEGHVVPPLEVPVAVPPDELVVPPDELLAVAFVPLVVPLPW